MIGYQHGTANREGSALAYLREVPAYLGAPDGQAPDPLSTLSIREVEIVLDNLSYTMIVSYQVEKRLNDHREGGR